MDKLDKICIHWSVGQYTPNVDDLSHYHFLVDDKGSIHNGDRPPESNLAASVKSGTYQAHCGGGNTDCIGVSMASMLGYQGRSNVGKFPITSTQFESCCKFVAELCHKYSIVVTEDTIFTHYEFGIKHPTTSSAGKIDISFLPPHPELGCNEIGNFIRAKVKYYLSLE